MTRSTAAIHEIHPEDFEIARTVFMPLDHNVAVNAVLQGSMPGRVFVDDPYAPKTAVTWVKQRVFLAGSTQDDAFNAGLRKPFAEQIAPQAAAAGKVEPFCITRLTVWKRESMRYSRESTPSRITGFTSS